MAATPIISASVITQLQGVIARTLPDTCQVLRGTVTPDGRGGQTVIWAQHGTDVPCRVEAYMGRKGGTEADVQSRFEGITYWRLSVPAGTDVTVMDRLQISTQGNRTFEVNAVGGPVSYEVVRRVFCVLVPQ